jgi:hypothetical protein
MWEHGGHQHLTISLGFTKEGISSGFKVYRIPGSNSNVSAIKTVEMASSGILGGNPPQ